MASKKIQIVGLDIPQSDWAQTDETQLDFIKNKPNLGSLATKDEVAKSDLAAEVRKALDTKPSYTSDEVGAIPIAQKGIADGVATLDENGHVPSTQLPSYVDDVIEGYVNEDCTKFYEDEAKTKEVTSETGKIYLDLISLRTYRWGGSMFAEISESLALGETSNTAYYGDKGKVAYDHSQITGENPHGVTAEQVGLGNVNNTADADKPISTAQASAIADAKKAGTDAQANLNAHTADINNPHGVTLTQLGVTATADELNYVDGVTGNIQTQLNGKLSDYTIEIYNGTSGNPKPVRFLTVNYTTCDSENGVAIKVGMVSGHGNGTSYAFLQDAIIKVSYLGGVEVDNFKYYGASTGTYDGANRQYGDIFWVIDGTNKIVDFYVLMGQYARVNSTVYKKLTYSSGGTVTQHKSGAVYSTGTKEWANNSNIALLSDLPTSMTPTAHDQAASTITAGTFAGQVKANAVAVQTLGMAQVRNIYAGTSDLTAGSSSLATGDIYFVYE